MKIPKIKKAHIIFAIILVGAGSYYWYSRSKSKSAEIQYVTATAEKGTLTTSITGSGNIIVDSSANVDPTITGTVSSLLVSVGDKVKKGQTLFTIDNNDLSVSVAKSQSSYQSSLTSLENAKASQKQAQSDYDLLKDQHVALSKKVASKEKLDSAKAAVSSSKQSVASAKADLANQQLNAGKRTVTSPIDGTVNAINIKNGDDLSKLSSGSSRLVPIIIGNLSTLKAQVQVNEVDVSSVSIGQKATLTFDALPGFTATGKIEKIDSLGTLTQGVVTYNVTIGFDSLDSRIKPAMSVSAAIITDVKQDVLIVPSGAVKTQSGKSYVEVLNNGNTPEQKTVATGASNNTDTEISSGLSAGDKVVTQTITPNATSSSTSSNTNKSENSVRVPGIGGLGH